MLTSAALSAHQLGRSAFLHTRWLQHRTLRVSAVKQQDLLKGVQPEHREDVARVLEIAEAAANSWTVKYTDFHTPPVVAESLQLLQARAGLHGVAWGGYAQAERCRLVVGQEDAVEGLASSNELGGVSAVEVNGNFLFDPANHRDFLGACLGTGIERSKVGDIIMTGETGAQLLVVTDLVEFLELHLTQVRTVAVATRSISLSQLRVQAPKVQELKSTEASLRLDAIASAGFRMSRGKIVDLIKKGDVRVNWTPAKASKEVKAGDIISCSGKGRVEVREATLTRKGRFIVEMVRFM